MLTHACERGFTVARAGCVAAVSAMTAPAPIRDGEIETRRKQCKPPRHVLHGIAQLRHGRYQVADECVRSPHYSARTRQMPYRTVGGCACCRAACSVLLPQVAGQRS
eukprot:2732176-Prymnesium_polylepis.1